MSDAPKFNGYSDKVVFDVQGLQVDYRAVPLSVSVPYQPGSPEFAIENAQRELKARLSNTVLFPNRTEYEDFDSPFFVVTKAKNGELGVRVDVDTYKKNYKGEALKAALDAFSAHVNKLERRPLVRFKAWRQRRANEKAVRKQLNDMKARNGLS